MQFLSRFRLCSQFARQSLASYRTSGVRLTVGNSQIDPMASTAPLFLAPQKIIAEILADVSVDSNSTTATVPDAAQSKASTGNEFLDLLRRPPFSYTTAEGNVKGLTENLSATFLSSGDACLDFFFQVVPSTDEDTVAELLERAWKVDALTALKLVFHLRGVRGTGKSDKERFYGSALWLHKHHPATLVENMAMVAEFGYFKDLLELVLRLVEGPDETHRKAKRKIAHKAIIAKGKTTAKLWEKMKEERQRSKRSHESAVSSDTDISDSSDRGLRSRYTSSYLRYKPPPLPFPRRSLSRPKVEGYYARKGAAARAAKEAGTLKPREERVAASVAKDQAAKEEAATARKHKKLDLARRVAKLYTQDPGFQKLYCKVADVFAARLKADLTALQENRLFDISLAGKWAPSLDNSYDRSTLLCYAIATRLFPKEALPEYEGLDDQKYGHAVRDRLRREVFVPLRKVLELPEVYMSAQRWGDVNYRRVASLAMTRYKGLFQKHDETRFTEFLALVKKGEAKVAAGALLPHDIVRQATTEDEHSAEVAELQWKRMVEDFKEQGKLSNCIAVCDVSGSMSGEPMEVCIALGMLLADLSEEPWKGHVITFSANPEIHILKGETLKQKHDFVERMQWDMNTNLQLVFDRMLTMAQSCNLAPEKMIKRLFIFSDMEFDEASATPWEKDPWESDYDSDTEFDKASATPSEKDPSDSDYDSDTEFDKASATPSEKDPSDSDYDSDMESSATPWETDYEVICRKFEAAGYGTPPEIVFWNLRDSQSIPVLKSQKGVALVSGFSKNILKIFLEDDGALDPLKAMRKAISGEEYGRLKVVD